MQDEPVGWTRILGDHPLELLDLLDETLDVVVRGRNSGIRVAVEQARPVVVGLIAPGRQKGPRVLVDTGGFLGQLRVPLFPHLAQKALGSLGRLGLDEEDVCHFVDVRVEVTDPLLVVSELVDDREKIDERL